MQNLVGFASEGMREGLGRTEAAEILARFRARLEAERRAAYQRLERHRHEARALGERDRGDEGDRAVEGAESDWALSAARKERAFIREIDRALDKLARGEFGICEGTGEPIEPRRLEARPWARYSRGYLEALEDAQRRAA